MNIPSLCPAKSAKARLHADVPGIHVFLVVAGKQAVDGRGKPGNDGKLMPFRVSAQVRQPGPDPLAFRPFWPQIGTGRLAVDEPLANRVRSGRKQP